MKPEFLGGSSKKEFLDKTHKVKRVCPTGDKVLQLSEQRLKKRPYPQFSSKSRLLNPAKKAKLISCRKSLFSAILNEHRARNVIVFTMLLLFAFLIYLKFFRTLAVVK